MSSPYNTETSKIDKQTQTEILTQMFQMLWSVFLGTNIGEENTEYVANEPRDIGMIFLHWWSVPDFWGKIEITRKW